MTEKLDGLLLNNRNRLKDLFLKLTPNKDGHISLQDLTKFLKNVRIYPVKNI
jgi:Ca2+-binding EF-hand superfamily protein